MAEPVSQPVPYPRSFFPQAALISATKQSDGDAFVAAFLAARLNGEAMETSLQKAVAAGSAATEFVGGRRPDSNHDEFYDEFGLPK